MNQQAPMISEALHAKVKAFVSGEKKLHIDGKWVAAVSGETFPTFDPSSGREIARAAAGAAPDVDKAVAAARRAFDDGPWRRTSPAERTKLLNRLADLVEENADELALIETINNGKPFMAARNFDLRLAIEALRYNAGWATKITGDTIPVSLPGEWHAYTLREAVGVAGLIVPWNVPLSIAISKLAPALAAGCTTVLKPAEQTPMTAIRLLELVQEAGFPDGVVNLVTGYGATAGAALVAHNDVNKISFTGSTVVGRQILAAAGGNMKRVSLELGGKSPNIIFADADLDKAIIAGARGIFGNTGQVCAATSRMFVEKSVFDKVVAGVADQARKLRIGNGIDPDTDIGPVISKTQLDRVMGYINSGSRGGANLVVGGHTVGSEGYFVEPTIFTDTNPSMPIMSEEIFGPVLCAVPFEIDDLDAIARDANNTEYGLSAAIWTRDISKAHRLAARVRSGSIRINAPSALDQALPFGGMKSSGWGRENGRSGIEAFTELKTVAVHLA